MSPSRAAYLFAILTLASTSTLAQVTSRISVGPGGAEGNRNSLGAQVSADGRYVAFDTEASNLVPGDTNLRQDVFVYDRLLGGIERVSIGFHDQQANDGSALAGISEDGRFVVFVSEASN